MIGYCPGGTPSVHFSVRKLPTISLVTTEAGGVFLISCPGFADLSLLYALRGATSVFLFWGASGPGYAIVGQDRGFCLWDGGRGLVGAARASLGVMVVGSGLGNDPPLADAARAGALQSIIAKYTAVASVAGIIA